MEGAFTGFTAAQAKALNKAYDKMDEENNYAFAGEIQKPFLK